MAKEFLVTIIQHIRTEDEWEEKQLEEHLNAEQEEHIGSTQEFLVGNDGYNYDIEDFNITVIDKDKKINEILAQEEDNRPIVIINPEKKLEKKRELDEFLGELDGELIRVHNVTTGNYSNWAAKGVEIYLKHLRIGVPIKTIIPLPTTGEEALKHILTLIGETPELRTESTST